jgi:hypothetical protein
MVTLVNTVGKKLGGSALSLATDTNKGGRKRKWLEKLKAIMDAIGRVPDFTALRVLHGTVYARSRTKEEPPRLLFDSEYKVGSALVVV